MYWQYVEGIVPRLVLGNGKFAEARRHEERVVLTIGQDWFVHPCGPDDALARAAKRAKRALAARDKWRGATSFSARSLGVIKEMQQLVQCASLAQELKRLQASLELVLPTVKLNPLYWNITVGDIVTSCSQHWS